MVIVSDNRETLDGLQTYFQEAGLTARVTRQLNGALSDQDGVTAVVLFPDDFALTDVMKVVEVLVRDRPDVLPVLVTCNPRRFQSLAAELGAKTPAVVIAKPAWGWTILDVIRPQSEA